MKMDELRGAFPAMPDATRDALSATLSRLDDGTRSGNSDRAGNPHRIGIIGRSREPQNIGQSRRSGSRRQARNLSLFVPALALLLALALAGAAVAVTYPQVLRWLVGPSEQPSAELESIAKPLDVAQTAGDIAVRLTGYVTDGQELALSLEMENADPTRPVFVVLSSVHAGETDIQRYVLSVAYDKYKWVPWPFLDVLPAQRNPVTYGWKFWIGDVDAGESGGETPITATLHILRPTLPFAIVDEIMHGGLAEYDEDAQAEIQDVIDTLLSFEGTVVAQPDDMDPQAWSERGYIPIDHHCDLLVNEGILDFVAEEAALTLSFTADLSGSVAQLTPDISVHLGDCEAVLRRVSLSPMSTALVLDLIPDEDTLEAAGAIGKRYGALVLCDESGEPLEYLSMDWIMTDRGNAQEIDGRWVCRYRFDMPGLAAFPEEIRLRLTGEEADPQALERFEEAMIFSIGSGEG